MRRVLLVLVLLAGACKDSKSKFDNRSATSGSPAAEPASAGPPPACDDAELRARAHDALVASKRYFDALQQRVATWSSDCGAVTKDLLGLEPEGDAFVAAMSATKDWANSLPDTCRARIQSFGEADPLQLEIEKQTPALEARVTATFQVCHDHPGFEEASKKGLRLLRRKH